MAADLRRRVKEKVEKRGEKGEKRWRRKRKKVALPNARPEARWTSRRVPRVRVGI